MLTPIDIQNHTLKTKMGGYNKKDTDEFLEQILASYEELYKENQNLKDKITSLSEGIQYYKQMENTLQKALVLAEKTSTETQEAAKSQADSVMREAQAQADALKKATQAETDIMKAQANRELEETRNHVRKLVQSYENYRLQFKKLAASQIEMLDSESFSVFVPELDELMKDAPDADSVMAAAETTPINTVTNTSVPTSFVDLPQEETPAAPQAETVSAPEETISDPLSNVVPFMDVPGAGAEKPEENVSAFLDIPEPETETEETVDAVEPETVNATDTSTEESAFIDPASFLEVPDSAIGGDSPFTDVPEETPVINTVEPDTSSVSYGASDYPDYMNMTMDAATDEGTPKEEMPAADTNPFHFIDPE